MSTHLEKHVANTHAYGHAGCCGCERDIDLLAQPSACSVQFGTLLLHFFFCPECFSFLEELDEMAGDIAVSCALEKWRAAQPNRPGIAMVNSLALQAHAGDLVSAYEIGIDLPRVVFDAIAAGEAEVAFPPTAVGGDNVEFT